jgi:low affinity Fe/Cu permease
MSGKSSSIQVAQPRPEASQDNRRAPAGAESARPRKHRSAASKAFHSLARTCSHFVGTPWAFAVALASIVLWAIAGPLFDFSDTWQLVINTGTTIVTFLIVFLIQNTQNHDAKAMHLKLDELVRAVEAARTNLVDLEDLSEEELDRLQSEFQRIREQSGAPGPND